MNEAKRTGQADGLAFAPVQLSKCVDAEAYSRRAVMLYPLLSEEAQCPRSGAAVALNAVEEAGWELAEVEKTLRAKAEHIREEMDQLVAHLDAYGTSGNCLGVLQGAGPALDRLCGEHNQAKRALEQAVKVANAVIGTIGN